MVYDTREGRFPRAGLYASALAERAVSGDFRFTRAVGEARYYIPLRHERTLVLRGVAGVASDGAPLSELFWIGGYDLLRGYAQDEFRGNRAAVGSAEYLFPVMEAVQAAVFRRCWRGVEQRNRAVGSACAGGRRRRLAIRLPNRADSLRPCLRQARLRVSQPRRSLLRVKDRVEGDSTRSLGVGGG
jgi:hypothetical protein